ncbi:hypothetical protein V7S43_005854 [Phytophthora oleae]|uniref:Uncharacterized protein n=1 Tax=Phytophthora oleae TaxID=2107226 RepID=A0ABD3FUX0_9STRA
MAPLRGDTLSLGGDMPAVSVSHAGLVVLVRPVLGYREYYAQFHGRDRNQLISTLENVQIYCSLQLASLLLLFVALHQILILGLSPVHQLAFVLEKQFDGIQIKLVFWVYHNAQAAFIIRIH